MPDRFIEHAERGELLAELGLDVDGICAAVRRAVPQAPVRNGDGGTVSDKAAVMRNSRSAA